MDLPHVKHDLGVMAPKEWNDDDALAEIANGMPHKRVGATYGVDGSTVYRRLTRTAELKAAYNAAKLASAHVLAERAGERLDALVDPNTGRGMPDLTTAEVSLATQLSKYDQWLAASRSEEYRDQKAQVQVNVSVGQLFHDVLQSLGRKEANTEIGPVVEAQLLQPAPEDDTEGDD